MSLACLSKPSLPFLHWISIACVFFFFSVFFFLCFFFCAFFLFFFSSSLSLFLASLF